MPRVSYQYCEGYHPPRVSAQVVGERLEQIRMVHRLTPRSVLADAKQKASPLHACFDWNNSRAAEKWRLSQAGALIRNVKVEVTDHKMQHHDVRAFVSVKVPRPIYESIQVVMANKTLARQVLQGALRELNSWRNKYHSLRELAGVVAAADRALQKFEKVIA